MDNTGIAYKAVANFLTSADTSLPKEVHIMNVHLDTWMYGWNWQTVQALLHGINELYNEQVIP